MNADLNRRSAIGLSIGTFAAILAGCGTPDTRASTTASAPSGSASATTVMVIRHAEKPTTNVGGVLPDGTRDKKSLSVRGWQRAGALVQLFAAQTTTGRSSLRSGLDVPTVVYASQPGDAGSRRPSQTVTPLAEALGLQVQTPYPVGAEKNIAAVLREHTGVALVAWEHHRIPAILDALGTVAPSPPQRWPDDRFDMVYVLTRSGTDAWTFRQVPQQLLSGDSTVPIT